MERLLVDVALSLLVAGVYVYVGMTLGRRRVSDEARLAARMFTIWWYGLGAATATGSVSSLAALAGFLALELVVYATLLNLLLLAIALSGLLYYLVYLYTGSSRWFVPILVFYVLFYTYLVTLVALLQPVGLDADAWRIRIAWAQPVTPVLSAGVASFLLLPQILGAIAYGSLYFSLDDRGQRARVVLVAGAFLLWFGTALLVSLGGLSREPLWQVTSRILGLGAALVILAAYRPPEFLRRSLGIAPVAADEAPAARAPRSAPE